MLYSYKNAAIHFSNKTITAETILWHEQRAMESGGSGSRLSRQASDKPFAIVHFCKCIQMNKSHVTLSISCLIAGAPDEFYGRCLRLLLLLSPLYTMFMFIFSINSIPWFKCNKMYLKTAFKHSHVYLRFQGRKRGGGGGGANTRWQQNEEKKKCVCCLCMYITILWEK